MNERDDTTTTVRGKAANGASVVLHVSSRLTTSQIKALREDKKRSIEYAKKYFALQAGQKVDARPMASRLSPSEIEQLQRNKKESIAYAQKVFQKK